jgi:hypothetical protein
MEGLFWLALLVAAGIHLYRRSKTYAASALWYAAVTTLRKPHEFVPPAAYANVRKYRHFLYGKGCSDEDIWDIIVSIRKPSENDALEGLEVFCRGRNRDRGEGISDAECFSRYLDHLEMMAEF